MRLLLLYDCLKSERVVVRMYAEVSASDEDVVRLWNGFNFSLKWSSKADIKEAMWNGNGKVYICSYRLLLFICLFLIICIYFSNNTFCILLLWPK